MSLDTVGEIRTVRDEPETSWSILFLVGVVIFCFILISYVLPNQVWWRDVLDCVFVWFGVAITSLAAKRAMHLQSVKTLKG